MAKKKKKSNVKKKAARRTTRTTRTSRTSRTTRKKTTTRKKRRTVSTTRRSKVELSLGKLASRKDTKGVALRKGAILFRLSGSGGGDYRVELTTKTAKVHKGAGRQAPLVEICGPTNRIMAVVEGRADAAKAFLAGGICVRGDVHYLENLAKALGLLKCG